ncbi:MAG: radical SAM protein [Thermoplasmatales archaeon]|nr:radical SAM protein [Thermoplasmatales archaeon]
MVRRDPTQHYKFYKLMRRISKRSPKTAALILGSADTLSNKLKVALTDEKGMAKSFPEVIDIELTVLCNLRCPMCWWWGENGIGFELVKNNDSLVKDQLTTVEVFRIIDQVKDHSPAIYLSGGEPFARSDAMEIIEYINKAGLGVGLTTNGTLISDDQIKRLSRLDRIRVTFSIDGPEDVHDKIRGKGNFKKTVNNIKKLSKSRPRGSSIVINTNTTFSNEILGRTEELVEELTSSGVDNIFFQHLWFTDESHATEHSKFLSNAFGTDKDDGAASHIIRNIDKEFVDKLSEDVVKLQSARFIVPVKVNPKLSKDQVIQYYKNLEFSKRDRCFIPWKKVLIKANGDVMFCPDEWVTKFNIGNIRETPLLELWTGRKAKQFRETLFKEKLFPACSRCCSINMG